MSPLFAFFGTWDLVIIAFIAMLLFGNRLPSMMRSLGEGVQEFKKGVAGVEDKRDETGDGNQKIDDKRPSQEGRPAEPAERR
jgi:sec-independent protein translocase protein TatA